MNKTVRSILSLVLLLCLVAALLLPAFAEEAEEAAQPQRQLHISNLEDFLNFTESCVRDVYSENLLVLLDTDLDLSHTEFRGIPIFSGIFQGNHHKITGLDLDVKGSDQGLFRYLTRQGQIRDLTVEAVIHPDGSRNSAGGIVGSSCGTIYNCRFLGEVSGNESIGGIAGINQVSGVIEKCEVQGVVRGAHFAGGIAGTNLGTIRDCRNRAAINPDEADNQIQTVNLTPEFLMGKEAADTVTDLGGIAGSSGGVIRNCSNFAPIGYPHMGYNIGGIAGSQRGYITGCKNFGDVSGRKEIGGIAGQMEPVIEISYSADTLQILREQLAATSSLANRASANIRSGSGDIGADISALHDEAGIAMDALVELLPSGGEFPDRDTVIAANNALRGSIGSMQSITSSLNSSIQATVSAAAGDIQGITRQVTAMSHTLDTAADNLGGTVTDISDSDTEEDTNAKVSLCENHGQILGDWNVGGITGAIAWENDKDPEEDLTVEGDRSLNFDSRLRAVILSCRNFSSVTAKKRNAGGIAGLMTMGLVKDSENTGFLTCEGADYLGGIAGCSNGFIRTSSSKCKIEGNAYLGGIAGQASVVTDCRSMVQIVDGSEKLGSILGRASERKAQKAEEDESPLIANNYYLPLADHLGAIDGIDYHGAADSLAKRKFMALNDLPRIFRQATITFLYPDGKTESLTVALDQVVPENQIPQPPQKEGYIAQWDHLEEIDLNHVFLDGTLEVLYTPCHSVLVSKETREGDKPILLAEGSFGALTDFTVKPELKGPEGALEAWKLPELSSETPVLLHLSVPEGVQSAQVLILGEDDIWRQAETWEDGSYLVFPIADTDRSVALIPSSGPSRVLILSIAVSLAAAGILTAVLILVIRKKHRKSKKA